MHADVLLLSTYDLGRQPFGLASPLAWLRRAGIKARAIDLSREGVDDAAFATPGLIGIYLPMHTATRLALPLLARIRALNSRTQLCAFGLYATLNDASLRAHGIEHVLGPEFEADLVDLALHLATAAVTESRDHGDPRERVVSQGLRGKQLPKLRLLQPDRQDLPPLARYASVVMPDGSRRVAGATEATRGCKHRCRHCPVVPVYDGHFRVVPSEVVLADVHAQVEQGAEHITFGDPDFLNGPAHALRIVQRLHVAFPHLTYDVTIKVQHLREHRELLPTLARTGCLFVTSAVESLDDRVLAKLEKGHTRADVAEAVQLCRAAGLSLAPTFVAFTPWTTHQTYQELLDGVEALDLIGSVPPIQWGLRLLVTRGSRLLELDDIQRIAGEFDETSLTYPWRHDDPSVDNLQMAIAALGRTPSRSREEIFGWVRELATTAVPNRPQMVDRRPPPRVRATIPYLDEPWYC